MRIGLGLLLGFLVLASGSHGAQARISLPQNSATAEVFDVPQAMRMFYGNYNVRTQTSTIRLPKNTTSLPAPGEEQMTVRVLFHSFVGEPVVRTLFLLTYAIPRNDETYDCHACAPVIGMSVFTENGGKWTIDASNQAVTFAGEWGKPPKDIQLVKIGSSLTGVKIVDVGDGNGEMTAVLNILVPWNHTVNLALQRVIADGDKGACDPAALPCYANLRSVNFVRDDDAGYFGVEWKLSGTDLPLDDSSAPYRSRKVSGLETYRFDNGIYRRVSQEGDRTYFDETVAKRKNNN